MKTAKRLLVLVGLGLLLLAVAGTGFVLVQGNRRPAIGPYAAMVLPVASANTRIQVRFAGVSTLLFDDGETPWMIDGFFTRPGKLRTLAGRIAPDSDAIQKQLIRLGVHGRLAAVVPAHSHYDHAMDSPVVAMLTGARLLGSASTLNIGRGLGMRENMLQRVRANETVSLGKWKLTFIPTRHSPSLFTPCKRSNTIDTPLVPPQRSSSWCAADVWAILVEHAGMGSMLVNASAGFVEGRLAGLHADLVFLGIGMLGKQSPAYREQYWNEIVRRVSPRRVIAVHWDDFWQSLDEPLIPLPYLVDDFDTTMSHLGSLARRDHIELHLPPVFSPFDPLATARPLAE
jgi:L-ascorbate metabolism protein UlaG (beta-lactamase superfamily)